MNKENVKIIIIPLIISFIVGSLSGIFATIYSPKAFSALGWDFLKISDNSLSQENLGSGDLNQENIEQVEGEGSRGSVEKVVVPEIKSEDELVTKIVEKVNPSVVSIVVSKYVKYYYQDPFDFFNDEFFDFGPFNFQFEPYQEPRIPTPVPDNPDENGGQRKVEVGGGTGFVISEDGLILTNKHVVSEQGADYTVITNDGEKYEAQILATDPFNDLALLKVEGINLPPLELGDSSKIKIGQTVIAIGNALGEYRNTVTKGVISGVGRTITAGNGRGFSETLEDVIQTDAPINFGNSGGPLIDLQGKVIGVNTAIASGGQLIGFAIPINQAKEVIESVKKYGKVVYPFLGVRYVLIDESIAKKNNLPVDYGALIVRGENVTDLAVVPGSPADKAGLMENDIILEVQGEKVTKENNLGKLIRKHKPGDTIELKILRKGEEKTVEVTLDEYKG